MIVGSIGACMRKIQRAANSYATVPRRVFGLFTGICATIRNKSMSKHIVILLFTALLLPVAASCQLVEDFTPSRGNCCLPAAAQTLANQLQDWNQLGRYYADNQRVKALPQDPRRVVFMGRFHHRRVEAGGVFPGQAVRESRHQRADHAADAGADVSGRDRPQAGGAGDFRGD